MSARKMDHRVDFDILETPPLNTRLTLPSSSVCIRKNGIEFRSAQPIGLWTEMTIGLESDRHEKRLECTGVVVACSGTSQAGYLVSLLFTNIPAPSQAVLTTLGAA